MQRLEVSGAVRHIYRVRQKYHLLKCIHIFGGKGLKNKLIILQSFIFLHAQTTVIGNFVLYS
jgi:hypothetical protein